MAPEQQHQRRHRNNINEPGHAHELTFSCYRRFPFLTRDQVCQWLMNSIHKARHLLNFDVWAWVFMPGHVHRIVRPRREQHELAHIRRLIKEPVARKALAWLRNQSPEWMLKLERRRGSGIEHLFWQSGGGYDRNITDRAGAMSVEFQWKPGTAPQAPGRETIIEILCAMFPEKC
jgi:putative transposase